MKLKYLLFFLCLIFYCECKETKNQESSPAIELNKEVQKEVKIYEYKINIASRLIIREKPSLDAKKIGLINECDLVKFINKEEEVFQIDNRESSFFKIETLDGTLGYAFGGYLWDTQLNPNSEFYLYKYQLNTLSFNILGKWKAYPDVENMVNYYYTFYKDRIYIDFYFPPEEATDYLPRIDDEHDYAEGSYKYDGCCEIIVPMQSGKTLKFKVIEYQGYKTLMLNCFIFDPKLKVDLNEFE